MESIKHTDYTDKSLLRKVQRTIDSHKMLQPGDRVLVAVSGGSDSVALGHLLHLLAPCYRISLHWVHVNHQLREAAIKEEEFVNDLAGRLGIPVTLSRIEPKKTAIQQGRSLEEVARELRREVFEHTAHQTHSLKIALGHHREDQAETVLMRILRGSGLAGVGAMKPVCTSRGIGLIRPLLECTKQELQDWLRENEIRWCEDSSNQDLKYFRNKMRHHLLPLLEKEYNNKIRERLCSLADCAQVDEEYLRQIAEQHFARVATVKENWVEIPLDRMEALPKALQRHVSRLAIEQIQGNLRRIGFKHWLEVEDLYHHRPGRSIVHLPRGVAVQKWQKKITFFKGAIDGRSAEKESAKVSAASA